MFTRSELIREIGFNLHLIALTSLWGQNKTKQKLSQASIEVCECEGVCSNYAVYQIFIM